MHPNGVIPPSSPTPRRFRRHLWLLLASTVVIMTGCGGGGSGGSTTPYLGRSYHAIAGDLSVSLSVDPAGRFTIVARDAGTLLAGKAAQGTVSSAGLFSTQSSDGAVQFDGVFTSGGRVAACTIRSGSSTLYSVDLTQVASGPGTQPSLQGSFKSADAQVDALLTVDAYGRAAAWVSSDSTAWGGLASIAADGSLTGNDGRFAGRLTTGTGHSSLQVTRLDGIPVNLSVPLEPAVRARWTFMVFLNAANDLQSYGPLNVNQMEKVGSTSDVNIVVQWKQANCATCGSPTWVGTRRYYIRKDNDTSRVTSPVIEDLGTAVDMGDWRQLYAFLQWAMRNYPAERYALVVWNHGAGWRNTRAGSVPALRSVSIDDSTQNEIQTWQLPQALNVTPKLDLLIFDASLMQMVEVAYEVRNSAAIMVGSEESPPGEGYVYDTFLADLASRPSMEPGEFAERIVVRTLDAYGSNSNTTQSAVDLSRVEAIVSSMDAFARRLIFYGSTYGSALRSARLDAESYLYRDNKDLWHYAELVRTSSVPSDLKSAAQSVQQALSAAVIAERHGSLHPNSRGLAVYVPEPSSYLLTYNNLALARVSQWDEWLRAQPAR